MCSCDASETSPALYFPAKSVLVGLHVCVCLRNAMGPFKMTQLSHKVPLPSCIGGKKILASCYLIGIVLI